jgi:hypothetical protein
MDLMSVVEEDGIMILITPEDVKHPEFMEWLVEQIEEGKDDYTYVALYKKEGDEEELIQVLWKNENY